MFSVYLSKDNMELTILNILCKLPENKLALLVCSKFTLGPGVQYENALRLGMDLI